MQRHQVRQPKQQLRLISFVAMQFLSRTYALFWCTIYMPRKCGGVQKMTNMRYEYAYTETLNLQFRAGWFNLGWNKLFEGWLVGWLVSQRGVCGFEVWRKQGRLLTAKCMNTLKFSAKCMNASKFSRYAYIEIVLFFLNLCIILFHFEICTLW